MLGGDMDHQKSRRYSAAIGGLCIVAGLAACGGEPSGQRQASQDVTGGAAVNLPPGIDAFSEADTAFVFAQLRVLGRPTLTLGPTILDEADDNGLGDNDQKLLDVDLKLGDLDVIHVQGSDNDGDDTESATDLVEDGKTSSGDVSLLNGLVKLRNLVGDAQCDESAAGESCHGSASISELTIGGSVIPLPFPIPPNFGIDVNGAISIAGLNVEVPIQLKLLLNEQIPFPADEGSGLTVIVAHLVGKTGIKGLAELDVDIAVGGPAAGQKPLSSNYHVITPGKYNRRGTFERELEQVS